MNTKDISLAETGDGGDFSIVNDDLLMNESMYQQIYLALFGGNIEASTKESYAESEDRFDYWGNSLIWGDEKTKQFNSETERVLQNVALNSSGRLAIEQAVNKDLSYLKDVVNLTIEVSILNVNRIQITIGFSELSNQQDKVLQMVFDNIKNELIIEKVL